MRSFYYLQAIANAASRKVGPVWSTLPIFGVVLPKLGGNLIGVLTRHLGILWQYAYRHPSRMVTLTNVWATEHPTFFSLF